MSDLVTRSDESQRLISVRRAVIPHRPSTHILQNVDNLVLLSGGLDSAVLLASLSKPAIAVTFDYGQQHVAELEAASTIAIRYGAQHRIIKIDPSVFGDTPLIGSAPIPEYRSLEDIPNGVPETYVPARNTIFLSHAVALATIVGAKQILLGVTAEDASFPDCTARYVETFNAMLWYATPATPQVYAPFQHATKQEIVALGRRLGVDFDLTSSCYSAKVLGEACHACEACLRRTHAFKEQM